MSSFGECINTSDKVSLCIAHCLYLKPIARINITAQLPTLKQYGSSISNWEVMERLKKLIKPNEFIFLKVIKTTLEFIRFEGELDDKNLISVVIARLDTQLVKLSGHTEPLKIKAAESKSMFPSRHDWDTYFRDAKDMDEMKPGERPDTIYFKDLPTRWFSEPSAGKRFAKSMATDCQDCKDLRSSPTNSDISAMCPKCCPINDNLVSEVTLKEVMQSFGEIRRIHIPCIDPACIAELERRKKKLQDGDDVNSNCIAKMDSLKSDIQFAAYVQFDGYISFCRAMSALKNMKLMLLINGKALTANITIDFDKSKHMSERSVRRRQIEFDRFNEAIRLQEKKEETDKRDEEMRVKAIKRKKEERELMTKQRRQDRKERRDERSSMRKEKRRERKEKERKLIEEEEIVHKIQVEERRILIANRKMETIRLLPELLERIKVDIASEEVKRMEQEIEREKIKKVKKILRDKEDARRKVAAEVKLKKQKLQEQEFKLRNKILHNVKATKELNAEKKRELLRTQTSLNGTRLKSEVVIANKQK